MALPEDTIRGNVIISVSKMERMPDGRIRLVYLTEIDLFMQAPKAIADPFLVK
jgi:hypothetical protein